MNLNVLLRGQSNAIILGQLTGPNSLKQQIERLLGFDGVTDTVTLRFQFNDPGGRNTANSGTALIGDWLTASPGPGGAVTWANNTLEQGLLNYVGALPGGVRAEPSVVLWLHNEYDSDGRNPGLMSAATWESAVRFDAAQLRAAFGSSVPYVFVEPIPYVTATDAGAQAIRLGMERLAADRSFNATLTAANDDLDMNADIFGTFTENTGHMSLADAATVAGRAARSIAEVFALHAKPGSAAAAFNLDSTGPIAVQAALAGPRQVTVTVQFDAATALAALDPQAAAGLGWTARAGDAVIKAAAVALAGPGALTVTFEADLPAGAVIHYGYGNTQLGPNGAAEGNAIYDAAGLPMRTPAAGLVLGAPALALPKTQAGTDGADTISAGAGGDRIYARKANDLLAGGAGVDTFVVTLGDGNDWVAGFTPGQDRIQFGPGIAPAEVVVTPMTLEGVAGLGVVYGRGGDGLFLPGVSALGANDLLYSAALAAPAASAAPAGPARIQRATPGDDTLVAGASGDTLIGGQGADYLAGGAGRDTFAFARGDGPDFVSGFAPGTDRLLFTGGLTAADIAVFQGSFDAGGVPLQGTYVQYGPGSALVFLAEVTALGANDIAFGPEPGAQAVQPVQPVQPVRPFSGPRTGDLDGNGRDDILWRGQGGEVGLWQMNGLQVAGAGLTPNPGLYWTMAGTGDFNGDGRSDILWRGQGAEVVIWQMNGTQIAAGGQTPNPGAYWSIAGTGDFNGDGRSDILWRGQGAEVVIWEMNGTQIAAGGQTPNPGTYWTVAGTGDFNGDGRSDILWRGQGAEVVIWEMNGTAIASGGLLPNPAEYWSIPV